MLMVMMLGLLGAKVAQSPAVADGVEKPAVARSTRVTAGSEGRAALHQTSTASGWSLDWRKCLRSGLRSLDDTHFFFTTSKEKHIFTQHSFLG